MEWTPTHRRTLVNIYAMYMITLGQVVLSGLAYLIRQWRWLQGTVSVAYVIILLYSWYVSSQTHSILDTLALSGLSSWEVFADLRAHSVFGLWRSDLLKERREDPWYTRCLHLIFFFLYTILGE